MRHQSIATRSIRRSQRGARASTRSRPDIAALQVFVFRLDAFVGTELFTAERPITVGRSHKSDLQLEGDTVSRNHCQLIFDEGVLNVEDLGSGNGTFVNRERVNSRRTALGIDAITVGNYTLKVRVLYAETRRPTPAPAAEPTTRIEAILSSGGTEELPLDLEGQVDERLYAAAIRRKSSEAAPTSPGPTIRMKEQIDGDSTMMAPEDISVSVSVSSTSGAELDPEVEARLKDLDDLIASLDARLEGRKASMVPWRNEPSETSAASSKLKLPKKSISTREFARDLASRLAVDGELVAKSKADKVVRTADVIPLRPKTKTGTTDKRVEIEIEIEAAPPKPATRTPTSGIPVVPKALLDGPETELLDSELPPKPNVPVPLLMPRETFIEEPPHPRKTGAHQVAKRGEPQVARLITQSSMRVDVQPLLNGTPSEDSSLYDEVWEAQPQQSKAQITRRPSRATKNEVRVEPAPAKQKTPPPLAPSRIGPPPLPKQEAKKLETKRPEPKKTEPNRKTEHGSVPSPPPLPQRRATEVRPKARIDDFDKSQIEFEGIEISARAGGKVINVSILRGSGEQYILGHATPQGQIAPAKAHLGLRLVRINPDRTVDLVFPRDVGGHLFRGASTVMFSELAEGRKYSCLRMEAQDIATIILGEGRAAVTYHLRFLRRAGSLQKAEKRVGRGD